MIPTFDIGFGQSLLVRCKTCTFGGAQSYIIKKTKITKQNYSAT